MSAATTGASPAGLADFMPFNPLDPAFAADPYPYYRRLRETSPVHRTAAGIWYLTRYDDVAGAMRDARFGHGDGKAEAEKFGWMGTASGVGGEEVRAFIGLDPPEHTRVRSMVTKGFTPRRVQRLEPRIQQIIDGLLDEALTTGETDLIAALAQPLPVIVICELLGVPAGDRGTFKGWSDALARGFDPDFVQSEQEIADRWSALLEYREYFLRLVERRRADPQDDLISALIAGADQEGGLSETELLTVSAMMIIAGAETTVNFIGNAAVALLRNPGQLAYARVHLDEPGVYQELLRYDPSVQLIWRTALADIELGGHIIPAGELVIPVIGAANRDPDVFADPDRLDLTRHPERHLAFSLGTHFCFGAPLATLQGRLALSSLLRRAPEITIGAEELRYKPNMLFRGLTALPVRLGAVRGRAG